jgi:hypothetical protein
MQILSPSLGTARLLGLNVAAIYHIRYLEDGDHTSIVIGCQARQQVASRSHDTIDSHSERAIS